MTAVDTDLSASSTRSAIAVSPEVERFVADTAQVATEAFARLHAFHLHNPERHHPDQRAGARARRPGRHQPPQPVADPNAGRRGRRLHVRRDLAGRRPRPAARRRPAVRRRLRAAPRRHHRRPRPLPVRRGLGPGARGPPRRRRRGCVASPRSAEIPVYVDRRQAEVDFILEQIALDPAVPAIVEANGGGTVWGRDRPRRRGRADLRLRATPPVRPRSPPPAPST